MQNSAKHNNKGLSLEFRVKEAVLALVILGMGGSALAWGVYQATPQKASAPTPNEQCRVLANAIVGADSETLFSRLNEADVRTLKITDLQMRAFQEELLSPRLASPFAWRPRQERIVSCEPQTGIIALTLTNPVGPQKNLLSLLVRNEDGQITFRYDDLLSMASYLDKKSQLTPRQLEERIRRDARAMVSTGLPGFDQLHPGPKAVAILEEEKAKLKEERLAKLAAAEKAIKMPAPGSNLGRREFAVSQPVPRPPLTE